MSFNMFSCLCLHNDFGKHLMNKEIQGESFCTEFYVTGPTIDIYNAKKMFFSASDMNGKKEAMFFGMGFRVLRFWGHFLIAYLGYEKISSTKVSK